MYVIQGQVTYTNNREWIPIEVPGCMQVAVKTIRQLVTNRQPITIQNNGWCEKKMRPLSIQYNRPCVYNMQPISIQYNRPCAYNICSLSQCNTIDSVCTNMQPISIQYNRPCVYNMQPISMECNRSMTPSLYSAQCPVPAAHRLQLDFAPRSVEQHLPNLHTAVDTHTHTSINTIMESYRRTHNITATHYGHIHINQYNS